MNTIIIVYILSSLYMTIYMYILNVLLLARLVYWPDKSRLEYGINLIAPVHWPTLVLGLLLIDTGWRTF